MNLEELKDKNISLVVWNAERENDVHVYLGKVDLGTNECYFINKEKGWKVSLNEEQLTRLKPVSEDLKKTLLNADYFISLSMGSFPETNTDDFEKTGMNWSE